MPRRAYIASLASGRASSSSLQTHRTVRTGRLVTGWARRSPAPAHSINGPPPITYRPVSLTRSTPTRSFSRQRTDLSEANFLMSPDTTLILPSVCFE